MILRCSCGLDRMTASERPTISFSIWGPMTAADLPGLYRRVCALLSELAPSVAECNVESVSADAVVVEALSRLVLASRRHGCQIRLRCASAELHELIAFMGLEDVLPPA